MRDATGQSLLDVAIISKHRELIAALIVPVGTGVDGPGALQRALSCAAQTGDVKLFKEVNKQISTLAKGLSISKWFMYNNALAEASRRGAADIVRVILSEGKHYVDWPLLEAWVHGHLDIVDMLIEADPLVLSEFMSTGYLTTKVLKRSHRLLGNSMDAETRRTLINHLAARGADVPADEDVGPQDEEDEDSGIYWATLGEYGTETLARHSVNSFTDQGDHGRKVIDVLFGACVSNNVEVFKYFLDVAKSRDYDLPIDDLYNRSSIDGSNDIAEMLVKMLPDGTWNPTGMSSYSRYPQTQKLVLAAGCGSMDIMKRILDITGIDVNSTCVVPYPLHSRVCTALSLASDTAIIRFLLDAKADINPEGCGTVLRGACEKLQPESVKLLLGAGADVNKKKGKGEMSALDIAINAKCPNDRVGDKIEIINMLLDAGASTRDFIWDQTVLHMPYLSGKQISVEPSYNLVAAYTAVLARDPGLVHCRDAQGATPLLSVAEKQSASPALMKMLIEAKADVNAVDAQGKTVCSLLPFEFCDCCTPKSDRGANTRECLQLLFAAGADPTLCNDGGMTLLMQLASMREHLHEDCHWLPERGFRGGPAFLSDIINAVAYCDAGGRDSSPDPGVVGEATESGAGAKEGSEGRYKSRLGGYVGTRASVEALDDEKQSSQPLKKARRH
jgi:hypothetical protein